MDTYTLSLRLTAVVESVTVDRSRVRMGLVAYARDRSMVTDQLPCTSSGKFEQRALAILAAALTP